MVELGPGQVIWASPDCVNEFALALQEQFKVQGTPSVVSTQKFRELFGSARTADEYVELYKAVAVGPK